MQDFTFSSQTASGTRSHSVEGGLGQIAKLLAARAELRVSCAFGTGKYGKNVWTSKLGMVSK